MSDIDFAKIIADDAAANSGSQPVPTDTPVEQVDTTAEATTAPADEAAERPEGDEGAKPKKPGGGFQKRISELTREKHEAQRRAENAERIAQQAMELARSGKAPAPATDDEPRPDQFAKYEDYVTARAEHRADKRIQEHLSKLDKTIQGRTAEQQYADKVNAFVAEAKAQGKGIEDFEDALEIVRSEAFPISAPMGDYLLEATEKAALVKYLADNEDEAHRISRLGTVAAVKELAKVEARLSAKPKPKTSSAPPPPSTVGGGAAAQQSIERMPYGDLKKLVAEWGRN